MDKTDNTKQPHIEESPSLYSEEDEINFLDFLLVILKHKKLIIYIVSFAAIASVIISLLLSNIYKSEATITLRAEDENSNPISGMGGLGGIVTGKLGLGGNEKLNKLKVILNSRDLTRRVVEKHNLMPILFEGDWDSEKHKWLDAEKPPTPQDAWELILNDLLKVYIVKDTGAINIEFEHKNPEFSKNVVEFYITELSTVLREEVISDAIEKKKFFSLQLDMITDSLLREKIYNLLAKEIERETFAKAQYYYGFLLIDPPIVPDLDKKVGPKRAILCITSMLTAFLISIFIAYFNEFRRRMKTQDPKIYNSIKKEALFWKKIDL